LKPVKKFENRGIALAQVRHDDPGFGYF
jgi:hypothetical protein